jgi:D-methionine transport system permease protein
MDYASLWKAFYETILMTLAATALSYLVALPLGFLLYTTSKKGLRPNRWINIPLGIFINTMRSIPCLILIVLLLPLNRLIFTRGTGRWWTMIIPLFVASFAFVSRLVESSLHEVDSGVVEMAKSLGASDRQILFRVLLKEARPSLLLGLALSSISILGYTAFAYDFGGGGLIALAYSTYGQNTYTYLSNPVLYVATALIVVIVQLIQEGGMLLAKKVDKRKEITQ